MFGASEVQMIGRYFGNTAAYSAAGATTRAVFHLASELEAASAAGTHHAAHQHQAELQLQRAEVDKLFQTQAQRKKKRTTNGISDDELVQALFAKVGSTHPRGSDNS